MFKQQVQGCNFIVCNTDSQALDGCEVPTKIQMGRGLGAGTNSTAGRNAALDAQDQIAAVVFGTPIDMLFITAGMGGGTGTGAAPVIAKMSRERGILTVAVVTLPFENEGPEALGRAIDGINELKKNVDSLLIINNEKLHEQFGKLLIQEAFPKADEVLATAVMSVVEIIKKKGYVNVDFEDVKTVMKDSGLALMGCGVGKGQNRIDDAIEAAINSPLLNDFEVKRDLIARNTLHLNVTNLSGVPSWMMSVLNRVLEISGKESIDEIWPNLEVFFHGGVAFSPYREQYKNIIKSPDMHYMETYNASEGFFGIQTDLNDPAMTLMIDYGVFYEFVPLDELDKPNPSVVPLSGVEVGKNYAMVISTSCGLWRYLIGDTVKFTQKDPYKFVITGRTKHFINAFGEELIVDNADKGLEQACIATGAMVKDYTAAPIFMDANAKCRHQWIIEFTKAPASIKDFAEILDRSLQAINSDYEAKRYKNITLQPLEIIQAEPGLFEEWLKAKGKLGGQHKIPRLSNSRTYIEELLALNANLKHE